MDPDKFYEQREKRQKERLRDRGGMFQPSTPGRMAAALFAKYAPSSSAVRKSPRVRKSGPSAAGGARKSTGAPRKSNANTGVPRKSAVAAVRKSTGARAQNAAAGETSVENETGAKPSAKKKTKKLSIEPVTVVPTTPTSSQTFEPSKAVVESDREQWQPRGRMSLVFPPARLSKTPIAKVTQERPPPSKAVHPALTGQPLVNVPPPPPKPRSTVAEPKKRPRMEESEVSEFVPSPPKRARTRAPSKKKNDAAIDAPSKTKTKGKGKAKEDASADAPKAKGKGKGKKAAADAATAVPKKARGKQAVLLTPIVEVEEIDLDLGDWASDDEEPKDGNTVVDTVIAPASPPKKVKRRPSAAKAKQPSAVATDESASRAGRKRKSDTTSTSTSETSTAPRKRKRAAKDTDTSGTADPAPRKRSRAKPKDASADSDENAETRLVHPPLTPTTKRRRIAAVLSTADSPVKNMHRQYDGKPDPIDCFLSD